MSTPVCELLGIEQPIVQAPMAAIPRLAAAVSNAGALGMVTLTWSDDTAAVIREAAALTARPFGGNFVLTSDHHRHLDQALEAGLKIVSFMWGDPSSYIEAVHAAGGLALLTVGSAEEARRGVAAGVDVVVAQGWEAGGHVWSAVSTLPLVPAVVDAVAPVPVIAAGGIGDARGVAAVLALGAQAAWLGTRFLLAEEMPIHEDYRRRLMAAAETDAQWYPDLYDVGWPDSPHRALRNSTSRAWEAAGRPPDSRRPGAGDVIAHFASGEDIIRYEPAPPMAGTTGDIEALSMWAGQSVALARKPQTAADIVAELTSRLLSGPDESRPGPLPQPHARPRLPPSRFRVLDQELLRQDPSVTGRDVRRDPGSGDAFARLRCDCDLGTGQARHWAGDGPGGARRGRRRSRGAAAVTLTGPGTIALCVLACLAFPLILVVCWHRGGQRWLTWLIRAALILAGQLSAVLLAAVLLNDSYGFYDSWQEVAGLQHPQVTNPSVAPGRQDQTFQPRIARAARTGHGAIVWLAIPGPLSRAGTHPAAVYLPPQYGDPAYRDRRFPVVELLPGYPGHPRNWVEQLDVAAVLDQAVESGHVSPLIAVMPTSSIAPPRDTECVNVAGGPQAETYLTADVPDAITRDFRAQPATTGWAVMGYSTGGYCAVNLALRHPGRYRAAVSLAGYNAPTDDRTTGDLFAGSAALRDQNTTIWRVRQLPPPVLGLLLMDTYDDKESFLDDRAFAAAASPPVHVSVVTLAHGGHNFTTWRAEELTAFAWLSTYLAPPLAPIPAVDGHVPG